jgi:hypothetical protein
MSKAIKILQTCEAFSSLVRKADYLTDPIDDRKEYSIYSEDEVSLLDLEFSNLIRKFYIEKNLQNPGFTFPDYLLEKYKISTKEEFIKYITEKLNVNEYDEIDKMGKFYDRMTRGDFDQLIQ